MTTATKKSAAPEQLARDSPKNGAPESLEFRIVEDNGGEYHWRIVTEDGAPLAQSSSYSSYEDAGRAVQRVRVGVESARFELQ